MQKKYLEPWMRVQIFDEETLTSEETGDDTNISRLLVRETTIVKSAMEIPYFNS